MPGAPGAVLLRAVSAAVSLGCLAVLAYGLALAPKPQSTEEQGSRTWAVAIFLGQNFGKISLVFGCIGIDLCK